MIKALLQYALLITALHLLLNFIPGDSKDYLEGQTLNQQTETALNRPSNPFFEKSIYYRTQNYKILQSHIPATIRLGLLTLLISIFLILGSSFLFFINPEFQKEITTIFTAVAAIPLIWTAPLSVLIFSIAFNFFSPSHSLVLPAILLAINFSAFWIRYSAKQLNQPLSVARLNASLAKGFPNFRTFLRDFWAPQILTFAGFIGLQLGHLFNGSLIIEVLFDIKGIGHLLHESMLRRDFALLESTAIFIVTVVFVFQMLGEKIHQKAIR